MRILGIDPGTKECGWMAIEVVARGDRARYLDHGEILARRVQFIDLLALALPDVVSIEKPNWQNYDDDDPRATRARAANLLEMNYVVGRFAEYVFDRGIKLVEISAQTWRLGLLNDRAPTDAQVAAELPRFIMDLPKRSNSHNRDAGGVAVAASRIIGNPTAEAKYVSSF